MTYEELTTEQKALLQAFTTFTRAWCGEQARSNNHAEAANDDYNGQTSAIIASLDASEVIPNTSGLSGAASLTKEELVSIVAHMQGFLSNYNTPPHRQLWTKAAGVSNMIG